MENFAMSQDEGGGILPPTGVKRDWFRAGQPVVIRLYPEYSVSVSLFPQSDDTNALVSEPLLVRLRAWQEFFDQNYRWDSGWRSNEARDRWATEAVPLEAALKIALEGKASLVVDLWPLVGRSV
jgi:hypothetical protein